MMKFLAIIEANKGFEGFPIVQWCKSSEDAETFVIEWMKNNVKTRPQCRYTIAECKFTIEG